MFPDGTEKIDRIVLADGVRFLLVPPGDVLRGIEIPKGSYIVAEIGVLVVGEDKAFVQCFLRQTDGLVAEADGRVGINTESFTDSPDVHARVEFP